MVTLGAREEEGGCVGSEVAAAKGGSGKALVRGRDDDAGGAPECWKSRGIRWIMAQMAADDGRGGAGRGRANEELISGVERIWVALGETAEEQAARRRW